MKNIGEFLKYIRKLRGFTQEQVAERLNIATPILSKWENDKAVPSLDMLCKLCNLLNVSIEECIAAEVLGGERILPPEDYDAVKLGYKLKDLRIKNGLSQAEVGKKIFVTSQTVSKWEAGGVASLEILCKLAELFGVTPTELLNSMDRMRVPITPVTAQPEKPKRAAAKIIAVILACIIFLGAVAGLIVGLVLTCRSPDDGQEVPNITEPEAPSGSETEAPSGSETETAATSFTTPLKEFYSVKAGGQDASGKFILDCMLFENAKQTPVFAIADGTITSIGVYSLTVQHSGGFVSKYNNVKGNFTVGQKLKKGQQIATADSVTVYIYLYLDGNEVDPFEYITDLPEPISRPPAQPAHVHAWEWSHNTYNHRQNCECGESQNYGEHNFENNNCSVCGYEKPVPPTDVDKTKYCVPVQAEIYRGYLEIFDCGGGPEEHIGVDFAAAAGDNVYAVADGVVKKITPQRKNSSCYIISIDHGNGLTSIYIGVKPVDNIVEGSVVKKGDVFGVISNDAYAIEDFDGAHLHFGMLYENVQVNPLNYIPYEESKT